MTATERIWYEYRGKLTSFIRNKVAEEAVDDLLQDVFTKIHARIDSLRDDTKLESWLFRITRNAIVDHYRSQQTMDELPDWVEQAQPDEEERIRKELSLCLEPMVRELPEKYRNALQMSEMENKTQKEIAEQENISVSGAKSRVQRGRALLKAALNDCCQLEINKKKQVISYEKKTKDCKFS